MSTPEDLFLRLSRLARRVPSRPPGELPPGLATRVLAQLRADPETESISLWERLSFGALPFAATAAALCFLIPLVQPKAPRPDADLLVQNIFISELQP